MVASSGHQTPYMAHACKVTSLLEKAVVAVMVPKTSAVSPSSQLELPLQVIDAFSFVKGLPSQLDELTFHFRAETEGNASAKASAVSKRESGDFIMMLLKWPTIC
mmetsp:Transcript_39400/g.84966  ORF Transcript_39400/g.84966 Transcript_39400/m.84966 type:complete len:105 (-) Transcript_39400:66-380(-)